jgi:hypothetical protein
MGAFDSITCDRDMPDGTDGRGRCFQTKEFINHPTGFDGNKILEITEDGRFIQTRPGWDEIGIDASKYTGSIEFYNEGKVYVATIEKGMLKNLETSMDYYQRRYDEEDQKVDKAVPHEPPKDQTAQIRPFRQPLYDEPPETT